MLKHQEKQKLWELIKPIKTAMMCTQDGAQLRARPMQHLNDQFDGTLLFFTDRTSHKVAEISRTHEVCLSYADPDETTFVSLSGLAELSHDQDQIDQHWNSFAEAWFPEGKDSQDVAILKVRITQAEYWDSPASKMVQLFEVAKANITDDTPDLGDNRKYG